VPHRPRARRELACHFNPKEIEMNRDQVKGRAKEVAGKVEKIIGRAVNSPKMEAKGLVKETAGKVQRAVGDVRDDLVK
jgi:uncharacterized protein YjbJ (UPF0337 family)